MRGYRGYIGSSEMGAVLVPQRVQNLVIRTYAQSRNILYLLSATEYAMRGCDMILRGALAELDQVDGMIFYSTHLLPSSPQRRLGLYRTLLASGKELHFALEELVIRKHEDCQLIEDIMMTREISARARLVENVLEKEI